MSNLCFEPDCFQGAPKQFLRTILIYIHINQVERCPEDQMHFISIAANVPSWSGPFKMRREKGGERTATYKLCIAQIHTFTKSVFQRRGKNMILYLQVHHLTTHHAKNCFHH